MSRVVRELHAGGPTVVEITMATAEALILLRTQLEAARAEIARLKHAKVRIEWP